MRVPHLAQNLTTTSLMLKQGLPQAQAVWSPRTPVVVGTEGMVMSEGIVLYWY
jgi:hypothetical protein